MSLGQLLNGRIKSAGWKFITSLVTGGDKLCPVCRTQLRSFLPFGVGGRVRWGALCPACRSLERDRSAWLEISTRENRLERTHNLLHVAPERCLERLLRQRLGSHYLTVDLLRRDVNCRASVEALPFPDGSFDGIICNHVLEHVQDDRRAMKELRRVLAPSGWALLQVPITLGLARTVEAPTLTSPQERRRRFGQHDHVRLYGRDYADRLLAAGLRAELMAICKRYSIADVSRYGLDRREILHFCRRSED